MSLLKHRGGSLPIFDESGKKVKTLHYGEGLDKKCEDCNAKPNERCVTASGKLLGKNHKSRG